MEQHKNEKYRKMNNCNGYCDLVVDVAKEQAFRDGYEQGRRDTRTRDIQIIAAFFTFASATAAIAGLLLRVFIKKTRPRMNLCIS
jgi:hypothetical protein